MNFWQRPVWVITKLLLLRRKWRWSRRCLLLKMLTRESRTLRRWDICCQRRRLLIRIGKRTARKVDCCQTDNANWTTPRALPETLHGMFPPSYANDAGAFPEVCHKGRQSDTHSVWKCWSKTENDAENSFVDISANQSNTSSTILNEGLHSIEDFIGARI